MVIFNHGMDTGKEYIQKPVFRYDDRQIEIVDDFKYLGVTLHANNKNQVCIIHRLTQCKGLVAA